MVNHDTKIEKVSVIVPVYNVEKYLEECLISILNQTYKKIEIILIDDGSTDGSSEICKRYSINFSDQIELVTKNNEGLNAARRDGFLRSSGELVAFVDSDDVIDLRYVEILKSVLEKNAADVVISGHTTFTDQIEPIQYDTLQTNYETDRKTIMRWLINGGAPWNDNRYMMTAWGKLYRREVIESVDWDFSNYRANEDEFWSLQTFNVLKNGITSVNLPLYFYRHNPNSITTSKYKNSINGRSIDKFEFVEYLYDASLKYLGEEYKNDLLMRLASQVVDFVDIYIDRNILDINSSMSAQKIINKYAVQMTSLDLSPRVNLKLSRMKKYTIYGYALRRKLKHVRAKQQG